MKHTRRDFLARTTCAALSASAIQATVRQWGLANLLATPNPTRSRPTIGRSSASSSTAASTPTTWSFPSTARTTPSYQAARPTLAIPVGNALPMNNPPSMGGPGVRLPSEPGGLPSTSTTRARWPSSPTSGPSSFRRRRPSTWATRCPSPTPCFRTPTRSRPGRPGARTSRSARAGVAGRPTPSMRATARGGGFPTITSISGSSTFCVGLKRPLSIGTGNLGQRPRLNGFTARPSPTPAGPPWTTSGRSTARPR